MAPHVRKRSRLRPDEFFPWSNESEVERLNSSFIRQNEALRAHADLITKSMLNLRTVVTEQPHADDEELMALRLGVRVLNSGTAALKLTGAGFYQPAITMVRDIMEVGFLVDLFQRNREHLKDWMSLPKQKRNQRYRPQEVRQLLDDMDGLKEARRREAYADLSNFAAHVSPEGFVVISPGGLTNTGPFPSADLVQATIFELAKVLPLACLHIASLISLSPHLLVSRAELQVDIQDWIRAYINPDAYPSGA